MPHQTNHAVGEARVVLHVRFPARSSSAEVSPSTRMLCTAPWAILRVSAVSALWSMAESRRSVCGVGRLGDPWLFVCPVLDNSFVLNTPQVEPDPGRAVVIGYQ